MPWRKKWQPTPVFLPGKSHGQRNLAGCSPWGCKESDTTEGRSMHTGAWLPRPGQDEGQLVTRTPESPSFTSLFPQCIKESESEVAQSCPTLCDPMDCSLQRSSVHEIFTGKSTGAGCHFLLQRIFPTQGSNLGLSHCRQMLYHLSHQ